MIFFAVPVRRNSEENCETGTKNSCDLFPGGGGGTPHMKRGGMLVVSLRGVNFGCWSHLGCSGQNAIIFSSEDFV